MNKNTLLIFLWILPIATYPSVRLERDMSGIADWLKSQVPKNISDRVEAVQTWARENLGRGNDEEVKNVTPEEIAAMTHSQKENFLQRQAMQKSRETPRTRLRNVFIKGLESEVDRQKLIDQHNREQEALRSKYLDQKQELFDKGMLYGVEHYLPGQLEDFPIDRPEERAAYLQTLGQLAREHEAIDRPYRTQSQALTDIFNNKKRDLERERTHMLIRDLSPYASGLGALAGGWRALAAGGYNITNPFVRNAIKRNIAIWGATPLVGSWLMKGQPSTGLQKMGQHMYIGGQYE